MASQNNAKVIRFTVVGLILVAAAYFGFKKVSFMMNNEDTENSQLETNMVPASPKVGGYVTEVLVKENQAVKAGDTLVKMDDRDLKIKVLQAEVALKNAEANVSLSQANAGSIGANVNTSEASFEASSAGIETANAAVATANANAEAAKIRIWKATQDFNRYSALLQAKSATQQQFEAAKAEKESAEAVLNVAQSQAAAAQKQVDVVKKQANIGDKQKMAAQTQVGSANKQIILARTVVEQRRAELNLAKLQASYVAVTAPIGGQVSKKNVQIGQLVNVGQPLMTIVDTKDLWVIANFKETQIADMKVGQKVKIKIDAYKNKEIEGTIESFSGATGSKFSLLPPDNATGNFVKVVQRVPTKIIISDKQAAETPLRAGMSVQVIVPKS